MSKYNSVVWSQGLFLRPEHFQQAQRHTDYQLSSLVRNSFSYGWGLSSIEIEISSLTNAQFALKRASGIMPDGLAFDTQVEGNLPPSLDLKSWTRGLKIYLAISRSRHDSLQVAQGDTQNNHRRFTLDNSNIKDTSHTGEQSAQIGPADTIEVAVPNLRLVSDDQNLDDLDCIPIAEISDVDSNGVVVLEPTFIPTCISITCSTYLSDALENLKSTYKKLTESIYLLTQNQSDTDTETTKSDFNVLNHSVFPLLNIVNRHVLLLAHLIKKNNCHPEELYQFLLTLLGEVSSIVKPHTVDTDKLKGYDHLNIADGYEGLIESIDEKMVILIESIDAFKTFTPVTLQEEQEGQDERKEKKDPIENIEQNRDDADLGGIIVDVGSK